ncbi:hypothetical protein WMY93_017021 [Mugilogobius chulae]|uniref:Selenoprotein O n=1 Tax=Mugilogobius chulae TaxID=88201 RepID=A0AAW0NZ82_9GOBI
MERPRPTALERLNFHHPALKRLPVDQDSAAGSRTVPGACFSLLRGLQPLPGPELVAVSRPAIALLGLTPQQVSGDPRAADYLSGSLLLPGAKPAAHCYSGHQFGLFAGQLGDGAVMYLGEVQEDNQSWEIQLKGAGSTPYSRDGDGRKVLRSSVREFLCSEAMSALGIPTTRAASIVTSDLYIRRDPHKDGRRVSERCSVILRLAPSFIRFGSFEIFLPRDEFSGLAGPSAGRHDLRAQLLDYVIELFYPKIHQISDRKQRNMAFFREVMERTARLVAQWQSVGFCHGVLNTDNMSILGLTLDYGPFAFMDRYDPDFVSNASDTRGRYSFSSQPSVCRWNLARLAEALGTELIPPEAGDILDEFMPTYETFYLGNMRSKLGLRREKPEDAELISDLLKLMHNTGADFTNTFCLMSLVPWPEPDQSQKLPEEREQPGDTVDSVVEKILQQCASIEELKVSNQPTMNQRELAMILSLAQSNPMMFSMVAEQPEVCEQLKRMWRLKELLETEESELKEKQREDWTRWIHKYRKRLAQEHNDTVEDRLRMMKKSNPCVVLRNYICHRAIQQAERGDYSEVNRVMHMLEDPFSDCLDYDCKPPSWAQNIKAVKNYPHVPRSSLEGASRTETVDILVDTYGEDDAIEVTLDVLTRMKLKYRADLLKEEYSKVTVSQAQGKDDLSGIREKLKSTLKKKYQNIYEGNMEEGYSIYLKKIYTELHMIEGGLNENSIEANDIFKFMKDQDKQTRTVLTLGIPGVGKTVCAQKFALSWAEGEDNQDIGLLFPIPFRELNPISNESYSLMQLLHQFFPETKSMLTLGTDLKVLFIFDGLDETSLPLDFKNNKVLRDDTEVASLDVLFTNLITGDLLSNALIWITSRPTAANAIPRKHVQQWTEIKGFTTDKMEEYFKRRLVDESSANKLISHVKSSKSLYAMCQIPVFCSITVTVATNPHANLNKGFPSTLTEMYVQLLRCQTDKLRDRSDLNNVSCTILKLAELAFRQLEKDNVIFYESDLKECKIDIKEAAVYSGVCTEVFKMEGRRRREIFTFVHLTVQEFLAALFAHYSYTQRKENVLLGFFKRISTKFLPKSMFSFHKSAIEKALLRSDGHWDLFLRFLLGLSLTSNQELLVGILDLCQDNSETSRTIDFIKEKIKEDPEVNTNLFQCLGELKDESLVQEIQSLVNSGRLAAKGLTPMQWSSLNFELMTSEATEEFDLKKYVRSEEGVVNLKTTITSSTRALSFLLGLSCEGLNLSENPIKDSGLVLLSDGLKSPNCKLELLRLQKCKLTAGCGEALAEVFSLDWTRIRLLDLGLNELHESGLKALRAGLTQQHCALQTLRLNQCKLNERCGADLALILLSPNLKELDLSHNRTGPEWEQHPNIHLLCEGLKSPLCKLHSLRLNECNLPECCEDLASVSATLKPTMQTGGAQVVLLWLDWTKLYFLVTSADKLNTLRVEPGGECYMKSALKKYACDLSLNVDTAHKSLLVLESGRRVTWLRESQPYSDHPDRFETVGQVLCHQALTHKHYWESSQGGPDFPHPRHFYSSFSGGISRRFQATEAPSCMSGDFPRASSWHPAQMSPCLKSVPNFGRLSLHKDVEWRGRWVDIAVAQRGSAGGLAIPEQLWVHRSVLEAVCCDDHYTAQHDGQSETIPAQRAASRRVAVYLDWPAGTLSFYSERSGTLRHLYTFNNTFTEPLYPGFGMEEDDCSATIVSLLERE